MRERVVLPVLLERRTRELKDCIDAILLCSNWNDRERAGWTYFESELCEPTLLEHPGVLLRVCDQIRTTLKQTIILPFIPERSRVYS